MQAKPIMHNTLFYGDNLPILRQYIPAESIDLIYLYPPFNSSRSYNVLFKDESGRAAEAQLTAFDDTWHDVGRAAAGCQVDMPHQAGTFKQAPRVGEKGAVQGELGL